MRDLNPIVPQSGTFQPAQKNVNFPLVLTYNPGLPDLKCLLRQFNPILQASTRKTEMFAEIPMVVFRRPQNPGKHLIRVDVNTLRNFVPLSCDPCNRPRCQLCSLIPECTYIVSHTTGQKHRSYCTARANCSSSNVIDCLTYDNCGLQYVGCLRINYA